MSKEPNLAKLSYTFLFDPAEAWSSLYEFETDLMKFFKMINFEAKVIKSIDGDMSGRLLYIQPKKSDPIEKVPTTSKSVQQQLKKVRGK